MSSSTVRPASSASWTAPVAGDSAVRQTQRWEVHGDVRGVGFRPFVRRVATELGLDGTLRTIGGVVRIDVAGSPQALAAFRRRLVGQVPPHAIVTDGEAPHLPGPAPGTGFCVEPTGQSQLESAEAIVWHPPPGGGHVARGHQAIAAAVAVVDTGAVIAVHDADGRALVCDATRPRAVAALRGRARDWARPLPVMVSDREVARRLAVLTADEERLLTSRGSPIVLVTAGRPRPPLAAGVNPVGERVGLRLPSTRLQRLLLAMVDRPLVVTADGASSPHVSGVPLGTLLVDAPETPRSSSPPSVVWLVDGRSAFVRRGRGEASTPVRLPIPARQPILALGGGHTFAIAEGHSAHVSEPSLEHSANPGAALDEWLDGALRRTPPAVVAHDLDPQDPSTRLAARWPKACRIAVQHHHAHVASCAAEHEIDEAFVGVAYDYPRMGEDGTLWGGEILVGDLRTYRRVGRFATTPLPGGAVALRRPARVALGYLLAGERLGRASMSPALVESYVRRLPAWEVATVRRMIGSGVNIPMTSSSAVLVDAVASLLGLRDDTSFNGEAALILEGATRGQRGEELPWRLVNHDGVWVYDPTPTFSALLAGLRDGASVSVLAAGFHATMASVTVALCVEAARAVHSDVVCLSGDLFAASHALATSVANALRSAGFLVYGNERVPSSDDGVCYGQLVVAAAQMAWQKVTPPWAARP